MQNNKAYLFLLPSIVGVCIFVFLPFIDVVRRSFMNAMATEITGLANYKEVFSNQAFILAAGNTGKFVLVCIPALMCISFIAAIVVIKDKTDIYKTIYLIPMIIPAASMAIVWKCIFHNQGFLNVVLENISFGKIDWLNSDAAFTVLVFTYIWKNIGYDMVLWISGLNGISGSYYEAAKVDGASGFACFKYITFPLLKPSVYMILILSFINSFKIFREAYLLSGDYPDNSIYMLQHVFNNWFASLDIQKMCAGAVIVVVVFAVVVILAERRSEE